MKDCVFKCFKKLLADETQRGRVHETVIAAASQSRCWTLNVAAQQHKTTEILTDGADWPPQNTGHLAPGIIARKNGCFGRERRDI